MTSANVCGGRGREGGEGGGAGDLTYAWGSDLISNLFPFVLFSGIGVF